MTYSIRVVSHRPALAANVVRSLAPERVEVFDGSGFPSFARLANECAAACPTETVVLCSDKMAPKPADLRRMLALLDEGHGLVGLYRFAFFGFRKELFRRIGCFDERFVGGGYEDTDLVLRMREADISYHSEQSVPYTWMESSWDNTRSKLHDLAKWDRSEHPERIRRLLPEEPSPRDWGEPTGQAFLPFARSTLLKWSRWLFDVEVS